MFPFIDTIHHHRSHGPEILPWEAKSTIRRGQPQRLDFDAAARPGWVHWPQVPPPEPIVRAGGHAGWLTRLFRRPVRAAAH